MKMTHLNLRWGRYAILYRWDEAGQGLPRHVHGPEQEHDITCTRGSVKVTMPEREVILRAGDYLGSMMGAPHSIECLEDNTSTLHEYVNGRPPGYENLPPEELDT
jgi:hypothetical protein